MQWTMSSYSLDLISLSFLGLCSDTIWAAVSLTYLRSEIQTIARPLTSFCDKKDQLTGSVCFLKIKNLSYQGKWILLNTK